MSVKYKAMPDARWLCAALLMMSAWGCSAGSEQPAVSPAARAEAAQIFSSRCAVCHGSAGAGDGAAAASLSPKPANFTDSSWQARAQDSDIEKVIREGGAAIGKSAAMPPNADLAAKPEVVTALRVHIRSLQR